MAHTGIVVFTGKSVATLVASGGSSCWVLNPDNAGLCDYLVCTWNSHSIVGDREAATHGEAFLVGRVSGTAPCKRDPIPNRVRLRGHAVLFDKYALISVPEVWPVGRRQPILYTADVETLLGLRLDSLRWKSTR